MRREQKQTLLITHSSLEFIQMEVPMEFLFKYISVDSLPDIAKLVDFAF